MENLWKGRETKINDTSSIETAKSVNSKIVSRMQAAVDNSDTLKRADELKEMVDNPTAFEGGRKWSYAEKNQLKQAENDYKEIQSEKKHIKTSLDGIDSLFDEKSQQSAKLSEDARRIESKLNEIDDHLRQYEEKLQLLQEKGDSKTEEEVAWEIKAREQVSKLMSEKNALSCSLTEIQILQQNLNDTEETITKELEKLLGGGGRRSEQPSGPQPAEAINREMAEIKSDIFDWGASIIAICATASSLFGNLFDSIKKISAKVVEQLKSCSAILAESSSLLSNYPVITMQTRP